MSDLGIVRRAALNTVFVIGAAVLSVMLATSTPTFAAAANPSSATSGPTVRIDASHQIGELSVPLDKSRLLRVDHPFKELSVGNPAIADVIPLTGQLVYVLGKKIGSTNLTISTSKGQVYAVVDLSVGYDIDGLKAKLYELMPNEKIEVRGAADSVILSGQISSTDALRRALQAAESYAPAKVTNMMTVGGSQQVLLKVRFAEVQRSSLKQLGFTNTITKPDGANSYTFNTGDGINPLSFGAAALNFLSGQYSIDTVIDALEQKGIVRTLAEPNLIALSGDTANFLAGGEFPIPVAQTNNNGNSVITVEFKDFGVGLAFTPTVVGGDLMNLEVKSEVSSIDSTVSVKTSNITIPGLRVRRAKTTVELKDGQSFAIAGLIQDNFKDSVRQIPGLGDVPVLGSLLRSSGYERQQTELVVFITAHLVQPTTATALASPTDFQRPPSPLDLFLLGKESGGVLTQNTGGVDGAHGYILP